MLYLHGGGFFSGDKRRSENVRVAPEPPPLFFFLPTDT